MDIIKDFGISKTVYSLCFPETQKVFENLLKNTDSIHPMYTETWTKKQDNYHLSFANTFKEWSSSNLNVNWEDYQFFYPSNGASEAIREQIAYLTTQPYNRMFVFEGEYEGYEAIATAMKMDVIKINRQNYTDYQSDFEQGGHFFLSQPSSIDGNVWNHFEDFIKYLEHYSNIDVYVDTVYVGCIEKEYKVNLNHKNIKGIFFSLSKVFGVYYHRIGGVFLKEANPLMYGNIWFKNILSMRFGEELMKTFSTDYFPNKYKEAKYQAINKIETTLKIKVIQSDALLLANITKTGNDIEQFLVRNPNAEIIRVCITPTLENIIKQGF